MWIVYVIQHTITKEIYIGFTNNLARRIKEHNSEKQTFTHRKNGKWQLVYAEAYKSKKDAILREKRLKHHGSAKHELMKRIKNSLN